MVRERDRRRNGMKRKGGKVILCTTLRETQVREEDEREIGG